MKPAMAVTEPLLGASGELDAQIAAVEARLVARQRRVRQRSRALVQRVELGVKRQAGSGLAIAAAGVALAWWAKRRHAATPPGAQPDPAAEARGTEAGALFASLIPLIWPLLPAVWRKFLTVDMASSAYAAVAPVLARLFRRRARAARP